MGSRPSVFRAPAVAELSRISVFGCAGAGTGVGAAALSDPSGLVERVDEAAGDVEDAVPGEAVLAEPGCGVSLEFDAGESAAGVGEASGEGGAGGAVSGAVLGFEVFAGAVVWGIPEADFGSAVGWVWANTKPVLQTQKAKVKNCKRRCISS